MIGFQITLLEVLPLLLKITYHEQTFYPLSENLECIAIQVIISNIKYTIYSVYKPPNKSFPIQIYNKIFQTSNPTIVLGDFNSKNTAWGCHSTNPQGTRLQQYVLHNNLDIHAPFEPTYYSNHNNLIPDILDIIIAKNVNIPFYQIPIPELDSDHLRIKISFNSSLLNINYPQYNKHINWDSYRNSINLNYNFPKQLLNTDKVDTEIDKFTKILQLSYQNSITYFKPYIHSRTQLPTCILNLIKSKHNLRKYWQLTRRPDIKKKINKLSRIIKSRIDKYEFSKFQNYIQQIHPNSRPQ